VTQSSLEVRVPMAREPWGRAGIVCCVAVRGTTTPGIAARPTATGIRRPTVTTIAVCGYCVFCVEHYVAGTLVRRWCRNRPVHGLVGRAVVQSTEWPRVAGRGRCVHQRPKESRSREGW
jgi:hypothetical protein